MAGKHADINPLLQSFQFTLNREKLPNATETDLSRTYTWNHKKQEAIWPEVENSGGVGYHASSVSGMLRRGVWRVQKIL